MAKNQQLSLNPATISGLCGRLKCCLRFENEVYKDLARDLPRQGCDVECPDGRGVVVARDILKGRLKVELGDRRVVDVDAGDVRVLGGRRDVAVPERDDAEMGEEVVE